MTKKEREEIKQLGLIIRLKNKKMVELTELFNDFDMMEAKLVAYKKEIDQWKEEASIQQDLYLASIKEMFELEEK